MGREDEEGRRKKAEVINRVPEGEAEGQ